MYLVPFFHSVTGFDPADSTTYWLGMQAEVPQTSTDQRGTPYVLRAGVIVSATVDVLRVGTVPTTESVTLNVSISGAGGTLIETRAMNTGASPRHTTYTNDGLSIAVSAGARIELQFVTPAWVTNPTDVRIRGWVLIRDNAENTAIVAQDSGISDNLAAILTNDSDISAGVVATTAAQSDADVNAAAILTNDSDISANLAARIANDSEISANLAAILTNDSDISANVVNITAAQSDADAANAAVLTNDSDISDHLVRILSNDSDISANLVHATRVA